MQAISKCVHLYKVCARSVAIESVAESLRVCGEVCAESFEISRGCRVSESLWQVCAESEQSLSRE